MVNFNSTPPAAATVSVGAAAEATLLKSPLESHRTPSPSYSTFGGFGGLGMKVGSGGVDVPSIQRMTSPISPGVQRNGFVNDPKTSVTATVVKASACLEAASRVSATMSSEMDRRMDLADRLNEAQQYYTYQQIGWPSSYSVLSMSDLPQAVLQRYEARKGVCLCGVFTEIKRVWTSVDTSLFLWRYDISDDVPVEYTGEDQAICSVGLVKPQPNIFIQTVQFVLVVATSIEIALVGLCGNGSLTEPLKTIAFLPLPMYSVPSDGVMTICITTSRGGRIFLGGQDGHVYELLYSAAESWMTKRCRKVCHTSGIGAILPSFFRLSVPDPVSGLVIDNARGILYARTEGGGLQVFDIGADSSQNPRRVAECGNVPSAADTASIGARLLSSDGSRDRRIISSLVNLFVVDSSESEKIQVVAVLSDGRRVYFSTLRRSSRINIGNAAYSETERPSMLQIVSVRPSPPLSDQGEQRLAAPFAPLQVEAAYVGAGVMLASDAGEADVHSRLIMTAVDTTIPAHLLGPTVSSHVTSSIQLRGLREIVSRERVDGRASAIVEIRNADTSISDSQNEFIRQILPQRRFVIVSTAGTAEICKSRPVDTLCNILEKEGEALYDFFRSYGAAEASSICMQLVADPPSAATSFAIDAAARALQNPQLVGEPCIEDSHGYDGGTQPGYIDMGHALRPPVFLFSGAHDGILLYISRLLHSVWDKNISALALKSSRSKVVEAIDGGALLKPNIQPKTLQKLEKLISNVLAHLESNRKRGIVRSVRPRGGVAMLKQSTIAVRDVIPTGVYGKRRRMEEAMAEEEKAIDAIVSLLRRSREAIFLLRNLNEESNYGRLTRNLPKDTRRNLVMDMTFRKFVATDEGAEVASQLVAALMQSNEGLHAEELSAALRSGCPSYFNEEDRKFYSAASLLICCRKDNVNASECRRLASEALKQLLQVPFSCDLATVIPEFRLLHFYEGVIQLPLKCAAVLDPSNEALRIDNDPLLRHKAIEERMRCYAHVTECLRSLAVPVRVNFAANALTPAKETTDLERDAHRKVLITLALQTRDELFQSTFYETMIELGMERELISAKPPYLVGYLKSKGGLVDGRIVKSLNIFQVRAMELLAHLYREEGRFDLAVQMHVELSERSSGTEPEEKVTLDDRERHLQSALLLAKDGLSDTQHNNIDVQLQLLGFQKRLRDLIVGIGRQTNDNGENVSLENAVGELELELKDINSLYYDYAVKFRLWEVCLEILKFSIPGSEKSPVDSIEHISKDLWDKSLNEAIILSRGGSALNAAANEVSRIGSRLYPFDHSFPLHHVARRMEEIAYGLWPTSSSIGAHDDVHDTNAPLIISRSLLEASKQDYACIYRAYETILSLRGVGGGESGALHQPRLRYRMLRTVYEILLSWANAVLSRSERSESVGVIVFACEMCIAEIKRLQIPVSQGNDLVDMFSALRNDIGARLSNSLIASTGSRY